jgi:hypothetical protein
MFRPFKALASSRHRIVGIFVAPTETKKQLELKKSQQRRFHLTYIGQSLVFIPGATQEIF